MALRHQWLSQAQKELDETLAYVFREFGERSAGKVFFEVIQNVRRLCVFPEIGLRYNDLCYKGREVRILHMKMSSIIYCHDLEILYVLAFWNNRNNDEIIADLLSDR